MARELFDYDDYKDLDWPEPGEDLDDDPKAYESPIDNLEISDKEVPVRKLFKRDDIDLGRVQEAMEDEEDEVECAWCFELYPKGDCVKEVDLGWLCPYCKEAIESRGEKLTFTNRESLEECGDQPIEECGDQQSIEECDLTEARVFTDEETEELLKRADEVSAKYDDEKDYFYLKYLFDMCAELNDEGEAFITSSQASEFEKKMKDIAEYVPVWITHDATFHRLPLYKKDGSMKTPLKHSGKLFNKDGSIKEIKVDKEPEGYEGYWRLYVD